MAAHVDSTYEVEHFSSVNAPAEQNEADTVPVNHSAMTLPEVPVTTGHTALEGGPRNRISCVIVKTAVSQGWQHTLKILAQKDANFKTKRGYIIRPPQTTHLSIGS